MYCSLHLLSRVGKDGRVDTGWRRTNLGNHGRSWSSSECLLKIILCDCQGIFVCMTESPVLFSERCVGLWSELCQGMYMRPHRLGVVRLRCFSNKVQGLVHVQPLRLFDYGSHVLVLCKPFLVLLKVRMEEMVAFDWLLGLEPWKRLVFWKSLHVEAD